MLIIKLQTNSQDSFFLYFFCKFWKMKKRICYKIIKLLVQLLDLRVYSFQAKNERLNFKKKIYINAKRTLDFQNLFLFLFLHFFSTIFFVILLC